MREVDTLLHELEELDVKLKVINGNIKYTAPVNALNSDLKERIRANKPAILQRLRETFSAEYVKDRHPRRDRHPRELTWSPEATKLIDWYSSTGQGRIPSNPFRLDRARRVVDSTKFKESIEFEISWGSDSPVAGRLVEDLQILKEKFGGEEGGGFAT